MNFWDASALIPLIVLEPQTEQCRNWYQEDPLVVCWAMTKLEILSALSRRARQGILSNEELIKSQHFLHKLSQHFHEVKDLYRVRFRAERLILIHPIKSADSQQLAAALVSTEEMPQGHRFLTFDIKLKEAARKEGFSIL